MSVQAPLLSQARRREERVIARSRLVEKLAFGFMGLMTFLVVGPILWMFWFIISHGIRQLNWSFLTLPPNAIDATGGVYPAVVGTFYLMIGTVLFALPLGIAGAIYLTEYAGRSRLVRAIRLAIVNLSMLDSELEEELIARSRRGLRVVITSDEHNEANERRARLAGAVFYAPKPLHIAVLRQVLEGVLKVAV